VRPDRVVAVLGTHTEVGKTWVSRRLLAGWQAKGLRVAARKPVQSFEAGTGPSDAELLARASGEDPQTVCPAKRWYPCAMAPPMAADVLGRARITMKDLFNELVWPSRVNIGLVETVGGVLSPLAHDGSSLDLVQVLQPDRVILVADAGLGTLNAVRLAKRALGSCSLQVLLNRYDASVDLHRRNAAWLRDYDGMSVALDAAELADVISPA
jgi:dethiobiotin synthetase